MFGNSKDNPGHTADAQIQSWTSWGGDPVLAGALGAICELYF